MSTIRCIVALWECLRCRICFIPLWVIHTAISLLPLTRCCNTYSRLHVGHANLDTFGYAMMVRTIPQKQLNCAQPIPSIGVIVFIKTVKHHHNRNQ
jgi:hypothetical protein